MRRRVLAALLAAVIGLGLVAGAASAAQPFAECGDPGATLNPAGFDMGGFANAEDHYAGSEGTHSLVSGNDHAVSQYDIACVHYTAAHS